MLTTEEKKQIIELRKQGLSYQAIHETLGYAINTIIKILKEEKKRKLKESIESQENNKKTTDTQIAEGTNSNDSAIKEVQTITNNIVGLIKKGKMKTLEKKEWEQRKEDLRELIKKEVDDRIADERRDAVEKQDIEWNNHINQCYEKKEVVTNLQQQISLRDATIHNLNNVIAENNTLIQDKQNEIYQMNNSYTIRIENLENQINELIEDKQALYNENLDHKNYIEYHLHTKISQMHERLQIERNKLRQEKTEFDLNKKEAELKLYNLFLDANQQLKQGENQKKELDELESQLKKKEEELQNNREQTNMMMNDLIEALKKRV